MPEWSSGFLYFLQFKCEFCKEEKLKAKEKRKDIPILMQSSKKKARRDKTFLSHQCKEIEENNRMEKARDLFKKIKDTKGTFHAKTGLIKDRNGLDLTEAENIKKRWQEYTELYKKDLHDQDNHDGVITHLEPDILEYEVKWALLRTKLVEEREFQLSYFKS